MANKLVANFDAPRLREYFSASTDFFLIFQQSNSLNNFVNTVNNCINVKRNNEQVRDVHITQVFFPNVVISFSRPINYKIN